MAHEHLLEYGAAPVGVREVVADSWLRSVAAGVDVDASRAPITLGSHVLGEYRAGHPLASIVPLLDDILGRAAEDCDSVMAIADERGQLLWVRGKPGVLMFHQYWKHTHLTVDVVPGRGSGFSVEAPEGGRFLIRSRLLTEAETAHFQLS
jgi:Protein of unknown function (DUF779)